MIDRLAIVGCGLMGGSVALALRRAGLAPEAIEQVGPCTVCGPGWPSYRREGERAGRALAFVEPAGA